MAFLINILRVVRSPNFSEKASGQEENFAMAAQNFLHKGPLLSSVF